MKKRLLAVTLISVLLLSACGNGEKSETESSGVFSQGSQAESIESVESAESIESVESAESAESVESVESAESAESVESTESIESTEIVESTESVESSASVESVESFSSVESIVSEEKSEYSEDATSEESTENVETPVIPVPDKLMSAGEDTFFNDSVFVGNSIMLGYEKFANKQRAGSIPNFLGSAKFFCAGSFGVYHNNRTKASNKDAVNPQYQGVKYSVEDAVGVMGSKTVYINFMGLNDLALYYDSKNCSRKCADDVIELMEEIKGRYPDVKIVILSATYLTASRNNYASLNNKNLSMLNNYLLEYCNANGHDFIDIASQLTENGCLADKYASDGYCHIGTDGYKSWTAILRDYAVRKTNGTYSNPEKMPLLKVNK